MKKLFRNVTLSLLLIASVCAFSWSQESPAASAESTIDGVKVKIEYHAPKVKDRIIWGGLVPYDKVWRTGADAATTIELSDNMIIEGNKVPKGKYSLFTMPKKGDTWTVIINKVWDQWGAFSYNEKEDLIRFDVKVDRTLENNESLLFGIKDNGNVVFDWEYKTFSFKIKK